jgi:hypothetical protein
LAALEIGSDAGLVTPAAVIFAEFSVHACPAATRQSVWTRTLSIVKVHVKDTPEAGAAFVVHRHAEAPHRIVWTTRYPIVDTGMQATSSWITAEFVKVATLGHRVPVAAPGYAELSRLPLIALLTDELAVADLFLVAGPVCDRGASATAAFRDRFLLFILLVSVLSLALLVALAGAHDRSSIVRKNRKGGDAQQPAPRAAPNQRLVQRVKPMVLHLVFLHCHGRARVDRQ